MFKKLINFLKPLLVNFAKAQVPGFSQNISQFSSSKSNSVGLIILIFGITLATANVTNLIAHAYIFFGLGIIVIKDAIVKQQLK